MLIRKNPMDTTIGNQQATSIKLAWLAGIWDGEGTISIYYAKQNNAYVARLTLSNTSDEMINEIAKIFDSLDIKGHIWKATKQRKASHKLEYHMTVNKLENVLRGTKAMLPYLIVKKAQAELIIRFIESRMKYKPALERDGKGRITSVKTQGYTKEELSFYEQIRTLNLRGPQGASETDTLEP